MRRNITAAAATPLLIALLLGAVLTWSKPAPARAGDSAAAVAGADAISAGGSSSCVLKGGGVWCWADNEFGQLGNGTYIESHVPMVVSGLTSGVTALSAGGQHTCAIKDGGAWCWGLNDYGALGNNSTAGRVLPVSVFGLSNGVTAISAGLDHTCAIKDGGAWCWGRNEFGRLGNNSTTESHVPIAVSGLTSGVTAISAGDLNTCAVKDGGAWCWGLNTLGQTGDNSTVDRHVPVAVSGLTSGVSAVSVGRAHACGLKDGGAWCWGWNGAGQLGDATTTDSQVPVAVSGLSSGVIAISLGGPHSCAVKNGGAKCWGLNWDGNLGDGTTSDSSVPVAVSGLGSGVTAIDAGYNHTCVLEDAVARCWGLNDYGQLGNGTATESHVPVTVVGLPMSSVSAISAGAFHTCALKDSGAWCWGKNVYGQLGDGTTTDAAVPVAVSGLGSGVAAISAGWLHTCALKDGGVWCWGHDVNGELGNGTISDSGVPVAVLGLTSGVSSISASGFYTCATRDGQAWCWGYNGSGQLGNGTTADSSVPAAVSGLAGGVTAIATGRDHTCAIQDGSVRCWGYNGYGQLGDGSTTSSNVSVVATGMGSGVSAVTANAAFSVFGDRTCALKNGVAWCWGQNVDGELGDGTTTASLVPVAVTGLSNGVRAISDGGYHGCALKDGGAWCWGSNALGQLGDGTTSGSSVPVVVSGLGSGVSSISAGSYQTCALRDGGVSCWGSNSNVPVAVAWPPSNVPTPTATPTSMPTPFIPPAGIWMALDCDTTAAGIQNVCTVPNVPGTAVDVGVYFGLSEDRVWDISSFMFDVFNPDRSRLEPLPCVPATACTVSPALGPGANPQFDAAGVGSTGGWGCAFPPISPLAGPDDFPSGVTSTTVSDSLMQCFTIPAGPLVTSAAPVRLAIVHYTVPGGAADGRVNLSFMSATVGSSNPSTLVDCGSHPPHDDRCAPAVVMLKTTAVPTTDTPTDTPTPTPTPAGARQSKNPEGNANNADNSIPAANLWLCSAPAPCAGPGEGDLKVMEHVDNVLTNPAALGVGAYEFQVEYDNFVIQSVNPQDIVFSTNAGVTFNGAAVPAGAGIARAPAVCTFSLILENLVKFGCVTSGQVPGPTGDFDIAMLDLVPHPDLSNDIFPGNNNGVLTVLKDNGCELADTLGHPVDGSVNGGLLKSCGDLAVTVRILEGDLNLDCKVDVADEALMAYRYGSVFGMALYSKWFDLEPQTHDLDIDIKDMQKVFGRDGSTCQHPIPPQLPLPPPVPFG